MKTPANFIFGGLWPLTGALFLFWVFIESLGALDSTAIGIGIGGLVVGLVPMFVYRQSSYYRPDRLDAAKTEQVNQEYEGLEPVSAPSADDTIATDF